MGGRGGRKRERVSLPSPDTICVNGTRIGSKFICKDLEIHFAAHSQSNASPRSRCIFSSSRRNPHRTGEREKRSWWSGVKELWQRNRKHKVNYKLVPRQGPFVVIDKHSGPREGRRKRSEPAAIFRDAAASLGGPPSPSSSK